MRTIILAILVTCLFLGCSAANIAQRGKYIDQGSISVGTSRKSVLAEFGAPADTLFKDGQKIDVFRVRQGEKTGSKAAKATGTILLGIATLGISEIVAHPVTKEKEYVSFEVYYDENDHVTMVNFLE